MPRTKNLTMLAVASALALTACGESAAPTINARTAAAVVEDAAAVALEPTAVPGEVKKQGLTAAFSNVTTSATDHQIVFVFALDDAGAVRELGEELKASVPGESVELFTKHNVVVVYGAAGKDRSAAVKSAVAEL